VLLGNAFYNFGAPSTENPALKCSLALGIHFSLGGEKSIHKNQNTMLRWALGFFIVAIIAAIFGFGGIAAGAASIAKILFFLFIVLFLLTVIFGARIFGK
jgi:uncharacterized membrane protein YtjA (UPF0391 family)